jgi:transposase
VVEKNPSQHQKKAAQRGAVVVFEDEVKFQQEGTIRQSWARRGVGFTVYHEPCKRSAGYYGAISLEGEPDFLWEGCQKFNSTTFCGFLDRVMEYYDKVCLIMDNVIYHKSKMVKRKIRRYRGRLWVYWLPKYSPELNAVEMVWRETRKDATHNQYFGTMRRLRRTVQGQFRKYQENPVKLAGTVALFLRA